MSEIESRFSPNYVGHMLTISPPLLVTSYWSYRSPREASRLSSENHS